MMVGISASQGCVTCRRRKKGCDLHRPCCLRCAQAGLLCAWYEDNVIMVRPPLAPGAMLERRRRSAPKVRSGCKNCKKRHIKCDERKPSCGRCLKSGLTCQGYHLPQPLLFDYEASVTERRRFQFFLDYTVPSIEVGNDPDRQFWTQTILQASHTAKYIRHALLAIQAYHESLTDSQNSLAHQLYAQEHYLKGLRAATEARDRSDLAEVLMMSIALRSLEVARMTILLLCCTSKRAAPCLTQQKLHEPSRPCSIISCHQ